MELSERVHFSFVGQDLQELGPENIGPTAFRFANARISFPVLGTSTGHHPMVYTGATAYARLQCSGATVGDVVLNSL